MVKEINSVTRLLETVRYGFYFTENRVSDLNPESGEVPVITLSNDEMLFGEFNMSSYD